MGAIRKVLTPEDLKRGDLMEPGWYLSLIEKYEEAVTKGTTEKPSDGSVNAIFHFKLIDARAPKKSMKRYFNEKALGFGKNLYIALDFPKNAAGGFDLTSELFEQTPGSKVMVYVKRAQGDKGPYDEISDYRKATEEDLKKEAA